MAAEHFYPLLFQPNLHEVIWGGEKLTKWKNLTATDKPIGESWEISAVPSSICTVANGKFNGSNLVALIDQFPTEILGVKVAKQNDNQLPLLIKFIDAARDLSIQVHPNDEMARRVEHKRGKTEMWYIIDAEPGAYLYLGFSKQIAPEEYERRVKDGTITDVIAKHKVSAGDVFYIPSGRVHAICKGILLAEIQQSSDVTYRIYDYNRPGMDGKLRQLHTEKAKEALDYHVYPDYRIHYIYNEGGVSNLLTTSYFTTNLLDVHTPIHRDMLYNDSFVVLMGIKGNTKITFSGVEESLLLREGFSTLIPACIANYTVEAIDGSESKVLESYV